MRAAQPDVLHVMVQAKYLDKMGVTHVRNVMGKDKRLVCLVMAHARYPVAPVAVTGRQSVTHVLQQAG